MPKPFGYPLRKSPASDPQQFRLYRMENEAIGARQYLQLGDDELKRYVNGLVRAYRMPRVKVVFRDLGRWAAEWEEPNILTFGTKTTSRDLLTAAHEVAHHLHNWLIDGALQQNHGKEFLGCYMSILDTSRFIPVVGMRAICERYKLEYVDPGEGGDVAKLKKAVLA